MARSKNELIAFLKNAAEELGGDFDFKSTESLQYLKRLYNARFHPDTAAGEDKDKWEEKLRNFNEALNELIGILLEEKKYANMDPKDYSRLIIGRLKEHYLNNGSIELENEIEKEAYDSIKYIIDDLDISTLSAKSIDEVNGLINNAIREINIIYQQLSKRYFESFGINLNEPITYDVCFLDFLNTLRYYRKQDEEKKKQKREQEKPQRNNIYHTLMLKADTRIKSLDVGTSVEHIIQICNLVIRVKEVFKKYDDGLLEFGSLQILSDLTFEDIVSDKAIIDSIGFPLGIGKIPRL